MYAITLFFYFRAQPTKERRDHRRQLDGSLRGGRPGAGPAGAQLPGDHHRLQPEVSGPEDSSILPIPLPSIQLLLSSYC